MTSFEAMNKQINEGHKLPPVIWATELGIFINIDMYIVSGRMLIVSSSIIKCLQKNIRFVSSRILFFFFFFAALNTLHI